MSKDIRNELESFESLIAARINYTKDIFSAKMEYVLGDFSIAKLPRFDSLGEVLNAIDPHGEVCEGIGYIAYKNRIEEGILTCLESQDQAIFILPLGKEEEIHNFIFKIRGDENGLSLLFIYLSEKNGAFDIDAYVADSFKDRLTGLFNLNTFYAHLEAHKTAGFICLFDLNKFKEINDTFGHEVGDDVLTLISSYAIAISSKDEIFYRRSGDEFLIMFLNDDLDYVHKIIGKLEKYMKEIPTLSLKQCQGLVCSASFGILQIPPVGENDGIDPKTQIKLADLAMYQAKRAGKRMHYISHEDAVNIVKMGNLDERLEKLSSEPRR